MTIDSQITFLATTDLDATARFYEETIGLDLALDQGTCRIYRVTDTAYVGFCRRDEVVSTSDVILTLVADDVDGWHARLTERGAAVEAAPRLNPTYGIYHFFVRDPSGYRVEIQRFEDPRW